MLSDILLILHSFNNWLKNIWMKQFFLLLMLSAILQGCRKEHSSGAEPPERYEVSFELDGEKINKVYQANETNAHSMYMFGGMAGNYFGVTCEFSISERAAVSITLGTLLAPSTQLSEVNLLHLLSPGDRKYGSLGAFSSYPARDSNRVEIAFTDKQSRRWCSTDMEEKRTRHGVETIVQIKQPHGRFTIDDVETVTLPSGETGYRVRGYFDCFLYEVNGPAKKRMKGNFIGMFCNRQ